MGGGSQSIEYIISLNLTKKAPIGKVLLLLLFYKEETEMLGI